jgi:hypothetical protein
MWSATVVTTVGATVDTTVECNSGRCNCPSVGVVVDYEG